MNIISFLDKIRSLSQNGLSFSDNEYDIARFTEILRLVTENYSLAIGIKRNEIEKIFFNDLGYITCKVGVNGAIFSPDNKILLEHRSDDNFWGLPGGWVDGGDLPTHTIIKEINEETGIEITPPTFLKIFEREAGAYNSPHSSIHLLYYCGTTNEKPIKSFESLNLKFFSQSDLPHLSWHRDHQLMANYAFNFHTGI